MNFRQLTFVICLLLFIPLSTFAALPEQQDHDNQELMAQQDMAIFNIGIVTDGNTTRDQEIISLFQKEIQTLAEEEFLVKFPQSMMLSGNDTVKGVNQALDKLFANPEIDLILTLGTIGSSEILRREKLPKPVVAPYVIDSLVQDLQGKDGTSGVPNLTYIDSMFYVDHDIQTLQKIVPFDSLTILLDHRELTAIPELKEAIRKLGYEYSMSTNYVAVNGSASEALAAIPSDTKAVMVGSLYHMAETERKLLIKGLIDRHLPGYSLESRQMVIDGLLAGDAPADMEEKLARRTSISVQDILLGEKPDTLQVAFARGYELTINMATARALDIYPSLDLMIGTNLLNEQRMDIHRRLTLQQAVEEALQANLDLSSAERRVMAGTHAVTEARSTLLPQITIDTGAWAIDNDRAELSAGVTPERAWTGSAGGSQQIYSERRWAGYTVEQHRQTGREMDRDTVRFNVMHEASTAYLNVLRAKTIEQLQKDNLKLTLANLDRARIRLGTGVAGPDEVYRWETKFASDKIVVLDRESTTLDTMEALNRILNRPLQELFIAAETDLKDPLLVVGDKLFFSLMNDPKYFQEFRGFAIQEALTYRPELKSIDAAIAAKESLGNVMISRTDSMTPTGRLVSLPDYRSLKVAEKVAHCAEIRRNLLN